MNINNRSFGEEQEVLEIPQAKSVYDTETMQLPKSVGYFIILIANEAHEDWPEEKHKHITDHNPDYVPTHVVIPKGTAICVSQCRCPLEYATSSHYQSKDRLWRCDLFHWKDEVCRCI